MGQVREADDLMRLAEGLMSMDQIQALPDGVLAEVYKLVCKRKTARGLVRRDLERRVACEISDWRLVRAQKRAWRIAMGETA